MLLSEVVATSAEVSGTPSRKNKVKLLAALLDKTPNAERALVLRYASGELRQRRTGVGWRSLITLPDPAKTATLTVTDVDTIFAQAAELSGPGSVGKRAELLTTLMSTATAAEQVWLRGVLTGGIRQGALAALTQEALAISSGCKLAAVRRAAMLVGGTPSVVEAAYSDTLANIRLSVGTPVLPMLASSAATVAEAVARLGATYAVDTKLDGIRIQVHKSNGEVLIVTRSLDNITNRLPGLVQLMKSLPTGDVILDGEALGVTETGHPLSFQDTASAAASQGSHSQGGHSQGGHSQGGPSFLRPYFFDILHHAGVDLLDEPAERRWQQLAEVIPEHLRIKRLLTSSLTEAERFAADVLQQGHEGVILKDPLASYEAGRRGRSWVKVKPVRTADLVVLGVEWGTGRRTGRLSNIHLGARDADTGEYVMLGKTFKGMTDKMLDWQTTHFLSLETHREGHIVWVEPVQVVEIAFDGLQRSSRYPGGVALRFARVVRYRDDKLPAQATTLADLLAGG
jgi:DNA ligase 1